MVVARIALAAAVGLRAGRSQSLTSTLSPPNVEGPGDSAFIAPVQHAKVALTVTAKPGTTPYFIWAWLLQNEFPFVSAVEALLVAFDVEFPVGVEVAREVDGAEA
jgi:hypothetical protein